MFYMGQCWRGRLCFCRTQGRYRPQPGSLAGNNVDKLVCSCDAKVGSWRFAAPLSSACSVAAYAKVALENALCACRLLFLYRSEETVKVDWYRHVARTSVERPRTGTANIPSKRRRNDAPVPGTGPRFADWIDSFPCSPACDGGFSRWSGWQSGMRHTESRRRSTNPLCHRNRLLFHRCR